MRTFANIEPYMEPFIGNYYDVGLGSRLTPMLQSLILSFAFLQPKTRGCRPVQPPCFPDVAQPEETLRVVPRERPSDPDRTAEVTTKEGLATDPELRTSTSRMSTPLSGRGKLTTKITICSDTIALQTG